MCAVENPSLGCKLIRCFHKVEGSEAEYLKRVWSVAQERGFSQVDKLDAELSKTSHSDEEEEQSPLRDLFDLYLVFAFVSNIPWTCLMVLATTVLEACGPDVPQRAAALQSMAVTLRSWTEADIEKAGKVGKLLILSACSFFCFEWPTIFSDCQNCSQLQRDECASRCWWRGFGWGSRISWVAQVDATGHVAALSLSDWSVRPAALSDCSCTDAVWGDGSRIVWAEAGNWFARRWTLAFVYLVPLV